MKGIRLLRTERTSRTRNAPVGERLTTGTYSGGLFVEGRPEERKASIADWRKCPASTLQERARHEPHFHGMTVKGLSLADLISREKYWYELPETIDPAAERRIRWVGKRAYQGREADAVEFRVKWTGRDGTLYEHHYEMVVEAARGFSVPFVSEAYRENAGALQVIGTIETECVDYGANTWGPKATVSTSFFTTPNGPGKSVTKIVLENVQLNVPIADSELMVMLADGTMVDDRMAGQYFMYRVVDEETLLKSIEDSCREAGFTGPIPIARHDTSSASGAPAKPASGQGAMAGSNSRDARAALQLRHSSPAKKIGGRIGLCLAGLAVPGLLAYVFIALRHGRPRAGTQREEPAR